RAARPAPAGDDPAPAAGARDSSSALVDLLLQTGKLVTHRGNGAIGLQAETVDGLQRLLHGHQPVIQLAAQHQQLLLHARSGRGLAQRLQLPLLAGKLGLSFSQLLLEAGQTLDRLAERSQLGAQLLLIPGGALELAGGVVQRLLLPGKLPQLLGKVGKLTCLAFTGLLQGRQPAAQPLESLPMLLKGLLLLLLAGGQLLHPLLQLVDLPQTLLLGLTQGGFGGDDLAADILQPACRVLADPSKTFLGGYQLPLQPALLLMAPVAKSDKGQQQTDAHRPQQPVTGAPRRRLPHSPDQWRLNRLGRTPRTRSSYPVVIRGTDVRQLAIEIITHEYHLPPFPQPVFCALNLTLASPGLNRQSGPASAAPVQAVAGSAAPAAARRCASSANAGAHLHDNRGSVRATAPPPGRPAPA